MASKKNVVTISKLYKARTKLLELLEKQGYDIENYSNFSINNLSLMVENKQQDMLLEKKEGKKVYIKWHLHTRLRPKDIHEYIDDLWRFEEMLTNEDDMIIIIKERMNDTITNLLHELLVKDKKFITIFNINHLQFNILEHSLVPKHEVLTQEEKKSLYKEKNIMSDSQMPEISRFDPVACAIGLRPGQVCKITRPSQTAITALYYRLCN